jgi:hypothetical protein
MAFIKIKPLDTNRLIKAAKCKQVVRYRVKYSSFDYRTDKIELLLFGTNSTIEFVSGQKFNLTEIEVYDDQKLVSIAFKEAMQKFNRLIPESTSRLQKMFKYTFKKSSKVKAHGSMSFTFEDEDGRPVRPDKSTTLVFRYFPRDKREKKIRLEVPTSEIFCLNNSNTQQ